MASEYGDSTACGGYTYSVIETVAFNRQFTGAPELEVWSDLVSDVGTHTITIRAAMANDASIFDEISVNIDIQCQVFSVAWNTGNDHSGTPLFYTINTDTTLPITYAAVDTPACGTPGSYSFTPSDIVSANAWLTDASETLTV